MSEHLCRHVDNDDPRHYSFARQTHLPVDYFRRDPLAWMSRRSVRWAVIAMLLAAVAVLVTVRADVPDEMVRATKEVRR